MTVPSFTHYPQSTSPTTFNHDMDTFISEMQAFITAMNTDISTLNATSSGTAVGIPYTFSTTTTDADPGDGYLRLDNATQNTATTIRADLKGSDGSTWTDVLATLDDSDSTIKGHILLQKLGDGTKWILFTISSMASPSGYKNFTVSVVSASSASPFSNLDSIVLKFTRTGDKGTTGTAGLDSLPLAAAGGTVDAITATYAPAISLTDGQACRLELAGANTSTTPTFAPNGLTARTIVKKGGSALVAGDLAGEHAVAILQYNSTHTRWELLNPMSNPAVGDHCVEVNTHNGYGSTNTMIIRYTTTATNVGTDITYADSATDGASFTINSTGIYAVYIGVYVNGTTNKRFGVSVNSAALTTAIQNAGGNICMNSGNGDAYQYSCSRTLYLASGDVVRPHADGTVFTAHANNRFAIRKVANV